MSTLMKGFGSSLLDICEADYDSVRELDKLAEEKASASSSFASLNLRRRRISENYAISLLIFGITAATHKKKA